MQPVHGVSHDRNGRVETKGVVGAADIIIDGLRDSHDLHRMITAKIARCRQRALAAHHNQPTQLMRLPIFFYSRNGLFVFGRIEP